MRYYSLVHAAMFDQVLARHEQTEWNRLGRRHGPLNSPLTDAGMDCHIDGIPSQPLRSRHLTDKRPQYQGAWNSHREVAAP